MSQKIIDGLKTLGLTENEADVYVALISNAPCFVAPIVQETRKHRQMVYNALDTLLKRNLVTRSIDRGKFLYEIGDPERLMVMIKEQEDIARTLIDRVKDQMRSSEEQVEIFRGADSYQTAIYSVADLGIQNNEYMVLNSQPVEYKSIITSFSVKYLEKMRTIRRNGGDLNMLLFPDQKKAALTGSLREEYLGDPYAARVATKFPEPPQTIWITGNHVYLRNRIGDPLLIHITSPDLSKRYREYFYTLWEGSEPLSD